MLIITRKKNEEIIIGDDIRLTIVEIRHDKVRIGITAPKDISVHRKEVYEAIKNANTDVRAEPEGRSEEDRKGTKATANS